MNRRLHGGKPSDLFFFFLNCRLHRPHVHGGGSTLIPGDFQDEAEAMRILTTGKRVNKSSSDISLSNKSFAYR